MFLPWIMFISAGLIGAASIFTRALLCGRAGRLRVSNLPVTERTAFLLMSQCRLKRLRCAHCTYWTTCDGSPCLLYTRAVLSVTAGAAEKQKREMLPCNRVTVAPQERIRHVEDKTFPHAELRSAKPRERNCARCHASIFSRGFVTTSSARSAPEHIIRSLLTNRSITKRYTRDRLGLNTKHTRRHAILWFLHTLQLANHLVRITATYRSGGAKTSEAYDLV